MSLESEFAKFGPIAALQTIAKNMSAPLLWHEHSRPIGRRILHGGTCCLVNTGDRYIGITACHVYDQYVKDKAKVPHLECQLGRYLFDPTSVLIDRDPRLDLATFSLDEATVNKIGGFAHQPAEDWPPAAPGIGAFTIFGGFPGHFRSESPDTIFNAFVSFFTKLTTDPQSSISCALNIESGFPWPNDAVLVPGTDLGGASGGPVLVLKESPVVAWSLVGILYEYQASFEIVMARPVTRICADGTLLH